MLMLWFNFNIKCKKEQIKQYLADYQDISNDEPACIQVSNHTSLIELLMICYLTEDGNTPSFVSKIEIKTMPFLGIIGQSLQLIFFDRQDRQRAPEVMKAIQDRISKIKQGQNYSAIQIFPEGARTNNTHIIKFQKGAFISGSKILIKVFRYKRENSALMNGLFFFWIWNLDFEVVDLGVFNPKYLGITDYVKDWSIFAQKVQTLIAKVANKKISQSAFAELKEYENIEKQIMKQHKKD